MRAAELIGWIVGGTVIGLAGIVFFDRARENARELCGEGRGRSGSSPDSPRAVEKVARAVHPAGRHGLPPDPNYRYWSTEQEKARRRHEVAGLLARDAVDLAPPPQRSWLPARADASLPEQVAAAHRAHVDRVTRSGGLDGEPRTAS